MTDVAPTEHVPVDEPVAEEEVAEEAPDHENENLALRAMLSHLQPDMDVDTELDNIAFRRDGSPVYIGELAGGGAAKPKAETQPRRTAGAKPDARSRDTNRAPAKNAAPNVSKMTHEERAKHYKETTLPALKRAGRH